MGEWDTCMKKKWKNVWEADFKASPTVGKKLTSVNVGPISGCLNGLKKEASRQECNLKKRPNYTVLHDSNSAALKPTP